jgi:elongation factor Ts
VAITAAEVKTLRDKTQASMGDCKKALEAVGGDMEKAVDWLRAKNPKLKAEDAGAKVEGAIALQVSADAKGLAVVVATCQTDFAARSENFKKLVGTISKAVLEKKLASAEDAKKDPVVAKELQEAAAITIRENIAIARAEYKTIDEGRIASYVHFNGTVGVAVAAKCSPEVAKKAELEGLLRDIAMHATAHDPPPVAVDRNGVPADLVEREKQVYLKQIDENPADQKKPMNIKEKMIEGKLRRFYEERALVEQKFVKDQEKTVKQVVEAASKTLGGPIELAWFVRVAIGQ